MRPGFTEISYPKNKYQFLTYKQPTGFSLVWVDNGNIISKGFSILPEFELHKKVRRNAKKHGALIKGHNIQLLKNRTYAKRNTR